MFLKALLDIKISIAYEKYKAVKREARIDVWYVRYSVLKKKKKKDS